ncbi:hypothetical protein BC477_00800 [Clavibacter michiganensis subsp. michiganensis]|uniref:Uncharacterized protein n=1 Tax=Clavibacter michiganensis subsp. michiganensis TaxID=33013 RepID=A0A251XF15_CLAMM|nr:hypothetical protein BC477_00800 [Clavibacter michiganensis subsp. michiganensis]OUE00886.1 hypothetical protein CMMCAS07_15720 [Clavibacter michiganensis subsp. michiganensis]
MRADPGEQALVDARARVDRGDRVPLRGAHGLAHAQPGGEHQLTARDDRGEHDAAPVLAPQGEQRHEDVALAVSDGPDGGAHVLEDLRAGLDDDDRRPARARGQDAQGFLPEEPAAEVDGHAEAVQTRVGPGTAGGADLVAHVDDALGTARAVAHAATVGDDDPRGSDGRRRRRRDVVHEDDRHVAVDQGEPRDHGARGVVRDERDAVVGTDAPGLEQTRHAADDALERGGRQRDAVAVQGPQPAEPGCHRSQDAFGVPDR